MREAKIPRGANNRDVSSPRAVADASSLSFRGRIFHPSKGYNVRTLLELRMRAGIGAILNKREWWVKWRHNDGAIRDKWFNEFEREFIAQTFESSTRNWSPRLLGESVPRFYASFPTAGTDDEKRAFVDKVCSRIPYSLIWQSDIWEELDEDVDANDEQLADQSREDFAEGNENMASYGQITWYFELVLFNRMLHKMPMDQWQVPNDFELGTEEAVEKATQFILAVHRGEVTKDTFKTYLPDGDHRPQIIDALWFHVDHIMLELVTIRECMTKTLEKVIENNKLDKVEVVTEFVSPGPVQETWMSDVMIKEDLKRKFVGEVAVLEDVDEDKKDWHPESDDQVLDLVHPSLYCCVFGETKGVSASEEAVKAQVDASATVVERMERLLFGGSDLVENEHRGSAKYQWIPSDFAVAADGQVTILSYINNLHPVKHSGMYDSIARIFMLFVPMFDRVLGSLLRSEPPAKTLAYPNAFERDEHEIPNHSAVPESIPLEIEREAFTLRGRKVQVIVKIAEIHLTPEKPSYPGGSWHVEGSDAEQIVATGIYYFGCENITESKLSFRVIVSEPHYQQDDAIGMQAAYGLTRRQRLVQPLGAVTAEENRCVVFPNTLQHHVEPFELADKSRPGVRKILAFFIVDPSKQIPSTAVVPPQQLDWLRELTDKSGKEAAFKGVTLKEAKRHRAALMAERKPVADEKDDKELFFSLCEH